eukprot:scaffold62258_cov72-Phaeocystis_antarctica.AAC.1
MNQDPTDSRRNSTDARCDRGSSTDRATSLKPTTACYRDLRVTAAAGSSSSRRHNTLVPRGTHHRRPALPAHSKPLACAQPGLYRQPPALPACARQTRTERTARLTCTASPAGLSSPYLHCKPSQPASPSWQA